MRTSLFATLTLAVSITGCEVPELETPQTAAPAQSAPAEVATQGSRLEQAAHVDPEAFLPDGRVDMSGVEGEPPMTSGIPREVHPKDPKQGKLSRRAGGSLGTTMQSMPWVKNETTFNLVIKPALMQYDAIHSHYPRSHQEFMEKFIPEMCPQVMPLPELEPGDEYLYDPEDHLLKIWRPAEATPAMRAKYLGEEASPAADESTQPAETGDPAASEDPSIRGRAEALQDQVNRGGEAAPQR